MMKRAGYRAEQAAAIETVSSNGGQIIPPIMGATAFLMAGFANIPYIQIAAASIIPAFLYVGCVFTYIWLTARKAKIQVAAQVESVTGREVLASSPAFLAPLGVVTFLLVRGYTLSFVGFWGVLTAAGVGLLNCLLRKEVRLDLCQVRDRVVGGVVSASEIAMICGLLGVITSASVTSGLAIKLPLAISALSHGILPVALLITMLISLLLGMGVPTPAAYILVALGAVPALLEMEVFPLAAHLFCFVSAIASHITPPIAVGALVAARIAQADYWATCWEAVKAAFPKYLLPFFFIYAPVIILRPDSTLALAILKVVTILATIFFLQVSISAHFVRDLRSYEEFIFTSGSLLCLVYIFAEVEVALFIGWALLGLGVLTQILLRSQL